MAFLGVYRALYDYAPQASNELAIKEGDLIFVLEKSSTDDWWRAKKKARDDEEEEPEGLIPNNYIEEAHELHNARALYDYTRQTDEEISFTEDTVLQVFDESDPDWTLVGLDGEFGFAPANYIDKAGTTPALPARSRAIDQDYAAEPSPELSPSESPLQSPAAALAGIIRQKTGPSSPGISRSRAVQYTPDASDDEQAPPSLPQRPGMSSPTQYDKALPPAPPGVMASPPIGRYHRSDDYDDEMPITPSGGFHMYRIHEMISHNGKNKKMPTTLGLNVARGLIMIAPEKSKDGAQREWTAEKLTHYSIEGKHVFMELVRPSKSIDFHAGSKDTAHEIVASLGEMAGAARAEGLREVLAVSAGSGGQKKGQMLYEFMAQGDDEVTVAVGDEVIVLDDTRSEEWWMVRRLKNGKEGVVPSSYVEVTGTVAATSAASGFNGGRSTVEQNREEEERMAREAVRSKRDERRDIQSTAHPKPNMSRVRRWTDRTGSFKVDAEFLGLKDGKIHLHKSNGVKIAVPVSKMSVEDLEYVEQATGQSLDDDKPLSDIKRRSTQRRDERSGDSSASQPTSTSTAGAAIQQSQASKYDWFDFFLQCGVNPQICERYSSAFDRDQMGEENMRDIDAPLLRTLGLKEGDILRVMKLLDSKFGRVRDRTADSAGADGFSPENPADGAGLFSGPGGALKNNTRKGRPAPAVQTSDTVDPRAFEQNSIRKEQPLDRAPSAPAAIRRTVSGFDDDAWDVKPSKQEAAAPTPAVSTPSQVFAPTGSMAELSLLSPPLQPTPAPPQAPSAQQIQPQATGADPSFFNQLARPAATQLSQQLAAPRQRPQASQQLSNQNSMLPPPPQRPTSAPQNVNAYLPPALRPQMTGFQSQIAPPGQSMGELSQQRFQQQYAPQLYPQQTGFGYGQANGIMPQPTGFTQYPQQQQQQQGLGYGQFMQSQPAGMQLQFQPQFLTSQQTGSPFADPPRAPFQPQPTGYAQSYNPQLQLQPQQTGINNYLPPPLQPQPTSMNGYSNAPYQNNGFGQPQPASQLPPMQQQQQPILAPLQPQKTGPAPPVRFGMGAAAQKLTPQPTGRRANLSQATPQNPFGF